MSKQGSTRWTLCAGYGVGAAGTGAYSVLPSILMMFYMTNVLGIPVSLATTVIMIPRILDFITDPLMGSLSDKTVSRWGARRPYLLAGGIGLAISLSFLFATPIYANQIYTAVHLMTVYILCTLAFTMFQIPYVALLGEIPRSYHDRTRLNMFRVLFSMLGMLIGGGIAPLIVPWAGGGRMGYASMSVVIGVFCGLTMVGTFVFLRGHSGKVEASKESMLSMLRQVFRNRPYVSLLATYIVQLLALGCMTAAIPYFATYVLHGGEGWTSAIFVAFNAAGLLAIPLWSALSRRIGKLGTFILTGVILIPGQALLYLVDADYPPALFLAQVALNGMALAGQQLTAFSMLADTMAASGSDEAHRPSATMSGLFIAGEKIGIAGGIFLAGTLFGLGGLVATTAGSVEQSSSAIFAIRAAYSFIPGLLILVSLVAIWYYRDFERQQLDSLETAVADSSPV